MTRKRQHIGSHTHSAHPDKEMGESWKRNKGSLTSPQSRTMKKLAAKKRRQRDKGDYVVEFHEYAESMKTSVLAVYGISIDDDECMSWYEADITVDNAIGWMNHGCGPGDALGCWTDDPKEAFDEQ